MQRACIKAISSICLDLGRALPPRHIFDFCTKLKRSASHRVLGDGNRPSVSARHRLRQCDLACADDSRGSVNIFNLGPDDTINVDKSLDIICRNHRAQPQAHYKAANAVGSAESPLFSRLQQAQVQRAEAHKTIARA